MKLDNIRRIAREELIGAPDWIDNLLTPLNAAIEKITQACMGQLELKNNQLARVITQKFEHGVELIIANQFKEGLKPIGIQPIVSDSPYLIDSFKYSYKTDGSLGITIKFDLGDSYVLLTRNANQSIPDVTATAIIWTTSTSLSGNLSWSATTNPTRITATKAGKYVFSFVAAFAANATGYREGWISKNGTIAGSLSRYGHMAHPNNGAVAWLDTGTTEISLAENDYIEVYVYQNSTAALNALGSATDEVKLTGHSLSYTGYSANVTFVVYGG